MIDVDIEEGWEDWREKARRAVQCDVAPDEVDWVDVRDPQQSLLGQMSGGGSDRDLRQMEQRRGRPRVPETFIKWGRAVARHRDPSRWDVSYNVLWRVASGEEDVLADETDPDVGRLRSMYKEIRRDAHKMKTFVRFRTVDPDGNGPERYVAWHEPDHYIVPYVASFFADRFANMDWTILTPDASVHWDGGSLEFGDGIDRSEAPDGDELEEMWKTYYESVFNPARVKVSAMTAEMPVKHWSTLPETERIPKLLSEAREQVEQMERHRPDAADVPTDAGWDELEAACQRCTACEQCEEATQAVWGAGDRDASVVFVGEQPGRMEDQVGEPFVGSAVSSRGAAKGTVNGKMKGPTIPRYEAPALMRPHSHFISSSGSSSRAHFSTRSATHSSNSSGCKPASPNFPSSCRRASIRLR